MGGHCTSCLYSTSRLCLQVASVYNRYNRISAVDSERKGHGGRIPQETNWTVYVLFLFYCFGLRAFTSSIHFCLRRARTSAV